MKKYRIVLVIAQCLFVGVVSLGIIYPASAQTVQAGIGAGGYFPVGEAGDAYEITPGVYGTFLWKFFQGAGALGIEAEGGYWLLQDAQSFDDFSASIIPLTGGIRYYPAPVFHLDAGVGIYRYSFEYKEKLINVDGTENDVGFYGGAGFQSGPIDIKLRAHFPDASETDFVFIGLNIGYLFLNFL